MSEIIINNELILEVTTCCHCGTRLGIEKQLFEQRKLDGKDFFCPNGHSMKFIESRDGIIEEQKEEIEFLEKQNRTQKCDFLKKDSEISELKKQINTKSVFRWFQKKNK